MTRILTQGNLKGVLKVQHLGQGTFFWFLRLKKSLSFRNSHLDNASGTAPPDTITLTCILSSLQTTALVLKWSQRRLHAFAAKSSIQTIAQSKLRLQVKKLLNAFSAMSQPRNMGYNRNLDIAIERLSAYCYCQAQCVQYLEWVKPETFKGFSLVCVSDQGNRENNHRNGPPGVQNRTRVVF